MLAIHELMDVTWLNMHYTLYFKLYGQIAHKLEPVIRISLWNR